MGSRNMAAKQRGKRRVFSPEYKAEVVQLCQQSGQAKVDAGPGGTGALTTAEREELAALRREVRTLKQEREILKKATAFFAKEGMS